MAGKEQHLARQYCHAPGKNCRLLMDEASMSR